MQYKVSQSWMKSKRIPGSVRTAGMPPAIEGGMLPDRASSAFSRVVERSETPGKKSTAPMFPQGIISEPLNDS